MSVTRSSRRCRVTLITFSCTALSLWAAGITVSALHVHMGIPSLIDNAASTVSVFAFVTHVTQKIHGGHKQMLDQERENLRRDTEAVLRLAGALISQHGAPDPSARPLQVVQSHPRQASA